MMGLVKTYCNANVNTITINAGSKMQDRSSNRVYGKCCLGNSINSMSEQQASVNTVCPNWYDNWPQTAASRPAQYCNWCEIRCLSKNTLFHECAPPVLFCFFFFGRKNPKVSQAPLTKSSVSVHVPAVSSSRHVSQPPPPRNFCCCSPPVLFPLSTSLNLHAMPVCSLVCVTESCWLIFLSVYDCVENIWVCSLFVCRCSPKC